MMAPSKCQTAEERRNATPFLCGRRGHAYYLEKIGRLDYQKKQRVCVEKWSYTGTCVHRNALLRNVLDPT